MQTLTVVERLWPELLSGEKRSTIRWREMPIVPGPMRYVREGRTRDTLVVTVARVTSMPLRDAARFLGRADDWPDPIMLEGMRVHYPAITMDDTVEVIEHGAPDWHPPRA